MNALASSSRLTLRPASGASLPPLISRTTQLDQLPSSKSASTTARSRLPPVPPLITRRNDTSSGVKDASSNVKVKGGRSNTLWQSWLNLKPSTRLLYGITVAVFAVGCLKVSDVLQAKMPPPGEEQGKDSTKRERKPRLFGFTVVDRKDS